MFLENPWPLRHKMKKERESELRICPIFNKSFYGISMGYNSEQFLVVRRVPE
jgi:hypothetical protein